MFAEGVGKTAVAEGIAQCLAGGYYVYDNNGENGGGWGIRNPFQNNDNGEERSIAGLSQGEIEQLPPLPPCPRALQGFRVVSVDLASLVAGSKSLRDFVLLCFQAFDLTTMIRNAAVKFRGDFEERIQKLIEEASSTPTILFIDEIHTLLGAGGGGGDGGLSAANLMKPALARGEIRGV